MKRFAVLGLTALLVLSGTARTARAQLTMQMSNGWNFTFAGNVNAFFVEQWSNALNAATAHPINGGLVFQNQGAAANIRTGLLPANVAFDAKGKEGDYTIDVHFGFYPEIQNGGCTSTAPTCVGNTHDQFGAQIDMRQVYLTFSSSWGQILAGREIDLYQRQNILTDATLFGVGGTGGNLGAGGTSLGRIGLGYVYPNFNAQITYSTPSTAPWQLSVGVFQPSNIGNVQPNGATYGYTPYPRVEAEITYTGKLSSDGTDKFTVWGNGEWQEAQDRATGVDTISNDTGVTATHHVNSVGAGAGAKIDISRFSIVGSGYYGKGLGTVFLFNGAGGGANALDGNPEGPQLRPSYGYIGQLSVKLDPQWTVVGSWGESMTTGTVYDRLIGDPSLLKYNALAVGSLVYQATKSLKWVIEYDYTEAANQAHDKQVANQAATGFMVFF